MHCRGTHSTGQDNCRLTGQVNCRRTHWVIVSANDRSEGATESLNSYGFIAQHNDGKLGFVKVLNPSFSPEIEGMEAQLKDLELRISRFRYELELLKKCLKHNIKKVVRLIDDDALIVAGQSQPLPYILFELAENDLRSRCSIDEILDTSENLRILHQAFAALETMHFHQIAHQNINPSNVLLFEHQKTKMGDLGSAHDQTVQRPGLSPIIAGDSGYAPPEQLYGYVLADWNDLRVSADLYMLGNLIYYVFMGVSLTQSMQSHLLPHHAWLEWAGTYDEVQPYLIEAWDASLAEFSETVDSCVSRELSGMLRSLTDLDPCRRGFPGAKRQSISKYNLRRYVSRLDAMQAVVSHGARSRVV